MNFLFFLFLSSTLISQSFMDAVSVIVLILSLKEIFKKNIKSIRLPTLFFPYFWEVFFGLWLVVVVIGLKDSSQFFKNFSEWKWILNLYSLFWFLQKIDWLLPITTTSSSTTTISTSAREESSFLLNGLSEQMEKWRPLWIVLLLCFFYGFIGLIFDFDLFKQEPLTHGRRFGGPFDDPMNFAHIYGMYTGLLSAFVLYSIPKKQNFSESLQLLKSFYRPFQNHKLSTSSLLLAAWFLTSFSILLSLTRGAWIGVSVGFLVIAFIYSKKIGGTLLGALSFIFTLMILAWSSFRERVLQAFHPSQNYDSERVNLWRSNWEMFKDHFYFGVGHGDYKNFLPGYFEKLGIPADHFQSHAHNQYLQALSNTGIFGFSFYMLFIGGMLFLTIKYYQKTKNLLFLASLAAQISFHLGAFTECNFERSKVRLVYLFFCALSLTLITKFEKNTNSFNANNLKENT